MKCDMPDCAEKFDGSRKSQYMLFIIHSGDVYDKDTPKHKMKICKKCAFRPVREITETLIGGSLSQEEVEKMEENNIILDVTKGPIEQYA